MRVEPYDAGIGCLAIRLDGRWAVVCPAGRIVSEHGNDEAGARNEAQFYNLSMTTKELREWNGR